MVQWMYITLGQGQNNSWSQCLFQIIKIQSICQLTASFVLQMTFFKTIFSIQMDGPSKLTLP